MSRIRVTLTMAGLVVALAAVALNTQAQPPAGGRGGGGGGGGRGQRGGGPGGPGGFGGPGSNLLQLASNEAVQKEIKMTDRQKAAVKKLSEDRNTKQREVQQQMRQQLAAARTQATQQAQAQALMQTQQQQVDPSLATRGSGAGGALAGALSGRGYQPPVYGGQVFGGQGQVDPLVQQQAAAIQGRMAGTMVQQQGFMMMRQAMQQLQQASENDLARVLDKTQFRRLKEIQLQAEGPPAVLREDVVERLEITPDQHAEIQEVLKTANQTRRQMMTKNFQFMRSIMPAPAPDAAGNDPGAAGGQPGAAGGQANGFGGRRRGQGGQNAQNAQTAQGGAGGQAAQGGQPGQGGPGGPGGGRGQNRPRVDPEVMRKIMEKPEVKAKMEEFQKEQAQLRQQEYAMVYKALDRRQVSLFKKMLGKPFDVDSLRGAFFRGGPGGRGNGPAPTTTTTDATKSTTAKAESTTATTPDSTTTATPKATTPRRQSLRERRGLAQPSGSSDSPN
jgi:hypothetical protein